jgi:TusA-related sulfurtransferase/predicted peroxiredoxin
VHVETRASADQIAQVPLLTRRGAETVRKQTDLRGRTITTAIVFAVQEELAELAVGDELELLTEPFPAIVPDLEAWCRTTGHEFVETASEGESWRVRLRKGVPRRNDHRVAMVVSEEGLEELLSPLGFALAAALGGAQVALYLQGPAVHVLAPGFRPRLRGLARPFSRFARGGLEKAGHVPPAEKLRQLQALNARLYACGPSLRHFRVDPNRLAFDGVIVCEYLTFMEVMQQADVQLYA